MTVTVLPTFAKSISKNKLSSCFLKDRRPNEAKSQRRGEDPSRAPGTNRMLFHTTTSCLELVQESRDLRMSSDDITFVLFRPMEIYRKQAAASNFTRLVFAAVQIFRVENRPVGTVQLRFSRPINVGVRNDQRAVCPILYNRAHAVQLFPDGPAVTRWIRLVHVKHSYNCLRQALYNGRVKNTKPCHVFARLKQPRNASIMPLNELICKG